MTVGLELVAVPAAARGVNIPVFVFYPSRAPAQRERIGPNTTPGTGGRRLVGEYAPGGRTRRRQAYAAP